jgi:hypothetical protein
MTARVSAHPEEDRLLELAYGEAPPAEARSLRQHVDGCTRCQDVLQGIAEVRSAVRSVPPEPAPERGLESLLAYGEQAAARARSRRRSLRLVGLLSVATAVVVAWVLVPVPSRDREAPQEMLARADVPPRAQAERPVAEEKGEAQPPAVAAPVEKRKLEQVRREASGASVAAAPKTAEPYKDAAKPDLRPPAVAQSTRRDASTISKEDRASPLAALGSGGRMAGNAQKARTPSEGVVDKKQGMNGAEIAAAAAPAALGKDIAASADEATGPTAVGHSSVAGAGAPTVAARSSAPGAGALESTAPRSSGSAAGTLKSTAGARSSASGEGAPGSNAAARPSASEVAVGTATPTVQALRPADRPPKAARLDQVRGEVGQATGDHRKALLLEQCRLESELQMGPAAVQTCSQVAREFPGTPEAKQATELATGFSVQLPPR